MRLRVGMKVKITSFDGTETKRGRVLEVQPRSFKFTNLRTGKPEEVEFSECADVEVIEDD